MHPALAPSLPLVISVSGPIFFVFTRSLQFSGGCRDVLGDLGELQAGAVHHVRLAAALGRTHRIAVTGVVQTGVLCT